MRAKEDPIEQGQRLRDIPGDKDRLVAELGASRIVEAPVQFTMLTAGQKKPRPPTWRQAPPDRTRGRSHPRQAAPESSHAEPNAHHSIPEARGLQLAPQPRRVAFAFVEPPYELGDERIDEPT